MEWFAPYALQREWGEEIVVAQTPIHYGKVLTMRAGSKGGLQYHIKEEAHYLVSGALKVRWDNGSGTLQERVVTQGTAWRVPPGAVHQEEAVSDVVTFEVSDPLLGDRVRVEPDYGLTVSEGLPSQGVREAARKLRRLARAFTTRARACDRWAAEIEARGTIT